jgi:oligopeptide transport system substrate-binding protein
MYTLNAFRDTKEPINLSKWEKTEYQQILHFAEREINLQKRQSYYLQAEELLLDEMPVAPICSAPFQTFKNKDLKISSFSHLINFKWAYFKTQIPESSST